MAQASPDWSRVPRQSWEWMVGTTTHGVHTYEGQLVWWERPAGPTGHLAEMAAEQAFPDFLAVGPPISSVPEEIVAELRAVLLTAQSA